VYGSQSFLAQRLIDQGFGQTFNCARNPTFIRVQAQERGKTPIVRDWASGALLEARQAIWSAPRAGSIRPMLQNPNSGSMAHSHHYDVLDGYSHHAHLEKIRAWEEASQRVLRSGRVLTVARPVPPVLHSYARIRPLEGAF
jgi:hypothetical protein